MFSKGSKDVGLQTIDLTSNGETKVSDDKNPNKKFIREFKEQTKKVESPEEFKKIAVNSIIENLENSPFGEHPEFIKEIRYFLHYLLLILEDDYKYGDKVVVDSLTEFDNYCFSQYRNKPELATNIKKIAMLSKSARFSTNPKENLLHHFVFLEENNIEITEILKEYVKLLVPKKNLFIKVFDLIFKKKAVKKKPEFVE